MTTVVVAGASGHEPPVAADVTFVLAEHALVTVRYADPLPFRSFKGALRLPAGEHQLMSRATGRDGGSQPMEARWNPPGYMRNVVETVIVTAA